jgi:hypothetical protein
MSTQSWSIVLGSFFIVVSVGFYLWGRKESQSYEDSLTMRYDLREFIEHTPERPEPGALKTGGIIGLVLGLGLVAAGIFIR